MTTTYNVYQDGVLVENVASSPRTITGLTNGTQYSFQVAKVVDGVEGPHSGVVLATPQAPVTPPPTPTGAIYGTAMNADALNNSQVGGASNWQVAYRFLATETANLSSIVIYVIGPTHPGYGAGTGGKFKIEVQSDDGTSNHFPSGTVLASKTNITPADGAGAVFTFTSPPALVAGTLYHVVFTNTDPSPTTNFFSVDGLYTFSAPTPWQPAFSNIDWANLIKPASGPWSDQRPSGVNTPMMAIRYSNGKVGGQGYIETWNTTARTIGGANLVREAFTVSGGDRTVPSASVRVRRTSGAGALTVRLETSAGVLVEEGTVPSSSIPIATNPSWVTLTFASSHVLTSGQSYNLVMSAPAGTTYSMYVIRKGASYGYAGSYFGDGSAQWSSNSGGTWTSFLSQSGNPSPEGDLQFYFAT